ncbi:MAG: cyclic nucleotide-binding domain-containing protein [Leptospiraceae bacterium]|nr:cyclic nucleotide-binding domain-containing protein [Leptospiraceae bacterium]
MNRALALLTENDWHTLRVSARKLNFTDGEVIIEAGSEQRTIYLILNGFVRITGSVDGHPIAIHRLGPNETFGEMSFLDEESASASVVADGDVQVEAIDTNRLRSLLASDPGFSERVYHSLAVTLSQRLRDATAYVQELNVNEVAQVNRFHSTRLGFITHRQMPEGLIQSIEQFDQRMRDLQNDAVNGQNDAQLDRNVADLCNAVIEDLERYTRPDALLEIGYDDLMAYRDTDQLLIGVGAYIFRQTFRWFMLSETMAHCYMKPRGFSDDIVTNELIHENRPRGDTRLGVAIDRWFLNRRFCVARRKSAELLAGIMRRLLENQAQPNILGLASGCAAETLTYLKNTDGQPNTTLVDLDQEALTRVARAQENAGLRHNINLIEQNVPAMVAGRGRLTLEPQSLITVIGLFDYLMESDSLALLNWIYRTLQPGGRALISVTSPNHADSSLLVHLLEWLMHERNVADFNAILARTKFGAAREWVHDEEGIVAYAILQKD